MAAGDAQERWKRVDEILVRLLEVPVPERPALLASACGGDPELQREVEGLLAADARAGGFLEPGVMPATALSLDSASEGSEEAPGLPLPPGTRLSGRYRVEGCVGRGGMGTVYRAWDLLLETPVALKVLAPRLVTRPGRIEAFRREVRLARRVTHPNVCRIHDLVEDSGLVFITMEYVDGESLGERLRRQPQAPVAWHLAVLRDVARGLAAAHAAGVIHRDLKPANVLLRRTTDQAVVADFGIAAEAAAEGRGAAEPAGTRGYMSPEQAAGQPLDRRSDLYSLGVLGYRMTTGRLPEGPASAADGQPPPQLARFFDACLQPNAGARPPDAQAALQLLERGPRRQASVAVAAVLLALLTTLTWSPGDRPGPPAAAPARVLVAESGAVGPAESWLAEAFRHLVVNELIDAWGLDAGSAAAAPAPKAALVRTRVWRDAAGRVQAAVTLPPPAAAREIGPGSLRELAQAGARHIAEGLTPPARRRPTVEDLRQVGARDVEAWRQLRRARRAARMQSWEAVRALAQDAARRDPGFPMPWYELALTYDAADQARLPAFDKAIELAERTPGLGAFSRTCIEFARRSRAGDRAGIGRVLEAFGALSLADDDLIYLKTRHALMFFYQGQPDAGLPLLEWVAEKWPQDAAAPKALAEHYLGSDEPLSLSQALRHARRAAALAPEDVTARVNLALALLLSGDDDDARAQAAIAALADPEEKQAAFVGGFTNKLFALHMGLGDLEEAGVDARRLLAAGGARHAQGQVATAALELSRGAFERGLARLGAAAAEYESLGMESTAALTYWEQAWQAYSLGRRRQAIASCRQIHRLNARHPPLARDPFDESAQLLDLVAQVEPGSSPSPALAARMRREIEDVQARGRWPYWRAHREILLRHALRDWAGVAAAYHDIESGSPWLTTYYAADALERLGRREEALRLYQRLVRHPKAWREACRRGQAWLRLGVLRQQAGDVEGARAAFESLLRLWDRAPRTTPELREAERRLQDLAAAGRRRP